MLGLAGAPIPVIPIAVSDGGVLKPPDDAAVTGWWVAGPRPGGPGRAVLTGHIDTPAGLGAFAALADLAPGDPVSVTAADGTVHRYLVDRREDVAKTVLDPAVLTPADRTDLLLITCIGEFDPVARSYLSNLLVYAEPVA